MSPGKSPLVLILLKAVKIVLLRFRSSHPEVSLPAAGVLKIYSKFTGEHQCRSVISIKLLATSFRKNTSEGLLLKVKGVISYLLINIFI